MTTLYPHYNNVLLTILPGMAEHITTENVKKLIFMHPITMNLCGFGIGKPVVVNSSRLFIAWPNNNLALSTVCVKLSTMKEMCWENSNYLILQRLEKPALPAKEIHLLPMLDWFS